MSIPENYVGKPQPGTPFAARAQELDTMRFIDIRNMAYMHYKVPDPQNAGAERAILTYMESLSMPREQVKRLVLQFEVQNGVIVPDGTEAQYFNAQPAVPTEGASPMAAQPQYPPQQMTIPGSQPAAAPGYPPAPPPPQGYPQQPPAGPPPAGPPQFQAPPPPGGVPGVPAQQYAAPPGAPPGAPEPPAPRGRKRAAAASGNAVAPPPSAPPSAPPTQGFQGPSQPQPGFPPAPPAPQFAGPPGPPAPPQGWVPPPPQAAPQAAPQQGIGADMIAISKTLDGLGGGLASTSKDVESLKAEVQELKTLNICILLALQHLWGQNPTIANWAKGAGFDTNSSNVLAFKAWLTSILPR